MRLPTPSIASTLYLDPLPMVVFVAPTAPYDKVAVAIAVDGVSDPLLRQIDRNWRTRRTIDWDGDPQAGFEYAPGTVLDITVTRAGKPEPPQRYTVTTAREQRVALR
jgi:hypothetical protein